MERGQEERNRNRLLTVGNRAPALCPRVSPGRAADCEEFSGWKEKLCRLERTSSSRSATRLFIPRREWPRSSSIEEKDIAGKRQRFYVLRILDTDRKIMVPVTNASAVGLRQVISEQEIREIFDILQERTIAFDNQTWNRRYRGFMDKIKTGSIYDVAEVLRDLYRLKTDKQLSFGERRMLDTARTLIVKEIAIAREQTEEQVKTEIEAIFLTN